MGPWETSPSIKCDGCGFTIYIDNIAPRWFLAGKAKPGWSLKRETRENGSIKRDDRCPECKLKL